MLKGNKRVPGGVYVLNTPLIIIKRKWNYIPQFHVHIELAQTRKSINQNGSVNKASSSVIRIHVFHYFILFVLFLFSEINCPYIQLYPHTKRLDDNYSVGARALIQCNEGYKLRFANRVSATLVCRIDGQWSPKEPPECIRKYINNWCEWVRLGWLGLSLVCVYICVCVCGGGYIVGWTGGLVVGWIAEKLDWLAGLTDWRTDWLD